MINRINKILPMCNFIVTSMAFTFQTTVLYPWHNKLEHKIDSLNLKKN